MVRRCEADPASGQGPEPDESPDPQRPSRARAAREPASREGKGLSRGSRPARRESNVDLAAAAAAEAASAVPQPLEEVGSKPLVDLFGEVRLQDANGEPVYVKSTTNVGLNTSCTALVRSPSRRSSNSSADRIPNSKTG